MKIFKQDTNGTITLTDVSATEHAILLEALRRIVPPVEWESTKDKMLQTLLQPLR